MLLFCNSNNLLLLIMNTAPYSFILSKRHHTASYRKHEYGYICFYYILAPERGSFTIVLQLYCTHCPALTFYYTTLQCTSSIQPGKITSKSLCAQMSRQGSVFVTYISFANFPTFQNPPMCTLTLPYCHVLL